MSELELQILHLLLEKLEQDHRDPDVLQVIRNAKIVVSSDQTVTDDEQRL